MRKIDKIIRMDGGLIDSSAMGMLAYLYDRYLPPFGMATTCSAAANPTHEDTRKMAVTDISPVRTACSRLRMHQLGATGCLSAEGEDRPICGQFSFTFFYLSSRIFIAVSVHFLIRVRVLVYSLSTT